MKLGIVGSRAFTNRTLMEGILKKYIAQYSDITVISGGADGADSMGKDLALQHGLKYVEYPPAFKVHNEYCVLPPETYGKPYNVGLFFERNTLIAKEADQVIAFLVEGLKCNGTMDTVDKAKGMGKPVFVFTQNLL
jgi:predicted Rossmann fold nucleotide-binding protein DprA/Smf involved in DNA uptake